MIRHHTPNAVIDTFRIMIDALLSGEEKPVIKAGLFKQTNVLNIQCYVKPDNIGVLLGRRNNTVKTPTKLAMIRVLKSIAYVNGINDIQLRIDTFSKMPKPEEVTDGNDTEKETDGSAADMPVMQATAEPSEVPA